MEQLLFSSDQKEIDKIVTREQKSAFRHACSYKNNQMQEFDKWKSENGWLWFVTVESTGEFIYEHEYDGKEKSFSELFTLFEKETRK